MKYMGSKRSMLENGLGSLICDRAQHAKRIVDLFCGAGSVAWFAAENTTLPVLAVDLQAYAVTLAQAVIGRNGSLDYNKLAAKWLNRVKRARVRSNHWQTAITLNENTQDIKTLVGKTRVLCNKPSRIGSVWNAYGGHYFSPVQALTFDYMLK
jgi:adenine-specific DNA-methyltransferase